MRLAERHQFHRDLGCSAAGQDAPVDFRKAELRVLRRNRDVAGEQRAIAAAKAPAVDHGDGRLFVPAQAFPPRCRLRAALCRIAPRPFGLGSRGKYSLRSMPADQASPSPVSTSTLHVLAEFEVGTITRPIWRLSFGLMQLRFSGRLNFTQAMPPSTVYRNRIFFRAFAHGHSPFMLLNIAIPFAARNRFVLGTGG
jgi:hypothetical protein